MVTIAKACRWGLVRKLSSGFEWASAVLELWVCADQELGIGQLKKPTSAKLDYEPFFPGSLTRAWIEVSQPRPTIRAFA